MSGFGQDEVGRELLKHLFLCFKVKKAEGDLEENKFLMTIQRTTFLLLLEDDHIG